MGGSKPSLSSSSVRAAGASRRLPLEVTTLRSPPSAVTSTPPAPSGPVSARRVSAPDWFHRSPALKPCLPTATATRPLRPNRSRCCKAGRRNRRADQAALRVFPTQQSLGADQLAGGNADLRLIMQQELVVIESRAQPPLEREAIGDLGTQLPPVSQ